MCKTEEQLNKEWYVNGGETKESLEREQEQDALNEFKEELGVIGKVVSEPNKYCLGYL